MTGIFEVTYPGFLQKPFSLVVLGNLLIAVQLILFMYIYVLKMRIKIFNGKFFKESGFVEQHKTAFKENPANLGYPDTGNGRYSMKLQYKEWYQFNCAQRCHLNYIEGLPLIVVGTLIGGIAYPFLTFAVQVLYILGRQLYSDGYMKGAESRVAGAGIYQLANLVSIILAVKSALSIIG